MELNALLDVVDRILDNAHTAVLSTTDSDGRPHSRWMTPTMLRGQVGALYAVTATDVRKTEHIRENDRVSWLIQSKSLDEIVEVHGKAAIIDNPTLKSDVLEAIGPHLTTFWKTNTDQADLVVIETAVERVDYLKPLKGEHASAVV